jgi:hypothetical protein
VTFLTPLLAGIVAAIAIPSLIILYFLKLRRRDLEISTTLLWKKAIQDLQANAPFQKLRRNLLLFLQLLALGAVLFAVAQPFIKGETVRGSRHVLLIDRSGSMASMDGEGKGNASVSRLDAAKQQALDFIDAMPEGDLFFGQNKGDQAMIIAFDETAEPVQPFTNDKRQLRAAVERITQTDKGSSISEAMRVAQAHQPQRRVVENVGLESVNEGEVITMHVYSDGKLIDADEAKPGVENSVLYAVQGKADAPNLAITTLKAERSYENPQEVTIFASLMNTQQQDRVIDVELLIDGVPSGIKSVTMPAAGRGNLELSQPAAARANAEERDAADVTDGAKIDENDANRLRAGQSGVVFKLERTEGMLVQARLRSPSTGDGLEQNVLSTDDRAWLVVPPAKRVTLAVVGRSNLFLKSALEGLPLNRVDFLTAAEFERLWQEGKAGQYDCVILDGVIPNVGQQVIASAPGATGTVNAAGVSRTLPPGNFLVLNVVPAGVGLTDSGALQNATIINRSVEHPVTRYLNLDPVQIATAREVTVDPAAGVVKLATMERGPALLEISKADTHALIVPFDYMESNWPLDVSFVVFLASSVNYLGEEVAGRLDARALRPGQELRDRLPIGVSNARIRKPDGSESDVAPEQDGSVLIPTLATSGLYEVTWDGPIAPGDVRNPANNRALRVYAANMLNAKESDVPAAEQLALAAGEPIAANTQSAARAGDVRLWPYLLMLGLVVVMVEWYIYNRKVYV